MLNFYKDRRWTPIATKIDKKWNFKHNQKIPFSVKNENVNKKDVLPFFHKEWRFPCKEDDDVEKLFPVGADRVAGHVRGEVHVGARDDVQKLAVVA